MVLKKKKKYVNNHIRSSNCRPTGDPSGIGLDFIILGTPLWFICPDNPLDLILFISKQSGKTLKEAYFSENPIRLDTLVLLTQHHTRSQEAYFDVEPHCKCLKIYNILLLNVCTSSETQQMLKKETQLNTVTNKRTHKLQLQL